MHFLFFATACGCFDREANFQSYYVEGEKTEFLVLLGC